MSEVFDKEHIDKEAYLYDELKSLGVDPNKKTELNDEVELRDLANNLKQSMFQDYKLAYSEKGDKFKEEARSTVTV
ncbi:MAG TPA: hypothetical protein VJZ68_01585 [Nitrososphaera sp.]|nr:hypothetical protein [Nitrososphaera sp.]